MEIPCPVEEKFHVNDAFCLLIFYSEINTNKLAVSRSLCLTGGSILSILLLLDSISASVTVTPVFAVIVKIVK